MGDTLRSVGKFPDFNLRTRTRRRPRRKRKTIHSGCDYDIFQPDRRRAAGGLVRVRATVLQQPDQEKHNETIVTAVSLSSSVPRKQKMSSPAGLFSRSPRETRRLHELKSQCFSLRVERRKYMQYQRKGIIPSRCLLYGDPRVN